MLDDSRANATSVENMDTRLETAKAQEIEIITQVTMGTTRTNVSMETATTVEIWASRERLLQEEERREKQEQRTSKHSNRQQR